MSNELRGAPGIGMVPICLSPHREDSETLIAPFPHGLGALGGAVGGAITAGCAGAAGGGIAGCTGGATTATWIFFNSSSRARAMLPYTVAPNWRIKSSSTAWLLVSLVT